jgi:hypothetical protein
MKANNAPAPSRNHSQTKIKGAIAEMKSRRMTLNPPGKPRLTLKELINKHRP